MNNSSHEVTDMYLVAALMAYGANYTGVDRANRTNQKFYFEEPLEVEAVFTYKRGAIGEVKNPTFEQFKSCYDTVTLFYPPNYSEVLRRVKGIIHS